MTRNKSQIFLDGIGRLRNFENSRGVGRNPVSTGVKNRYSKGLSKQKDFDVTISLFSGKKIYFHNSRLSLAEHGIGKEKVFDVTISLFSGK